MMTDHSEHSGQTRTRNLSVVTPPMMTDHSEHSGQTRTRNLSVVTPPMMTDHSEHLDLSNYNRDCACVEEADDSYEYSVDEFIQKYHQHLPQLVMVKNGYHGDGGTATLDTGQVLRVHGIKSQRRVLAKVTQDLNNYLGPGNAFISVPQDWPHPLCLVTKKGSIQPPDVLKNIAVQHKFPVEVQISKDSCMNINRKKVNLKSHIRISLEKECDITYMYGNPVNNGQLFRNIISIPANTTKLLTFSVVIGLQSGGDDYWKSLQDSMTHTVTNYIKFNGKIFNDEITVVSSLVTGSVIALKQESKESSEIKPRSKLDLSKGSSMYEEVRQKIHEEHIYDEISSVKMENASQIDEQSEHSIRANENKTNLQNPGQQVNRAFENKEYQKTPLAGVKQSTAKNKFREEEVYQNATVLNPVCHTSDIEKLTVQDLGQYLQILKLGHHEKQLSDALIDGSLLNDLNEKILEEEFGFKKFEAIKLMKFARTGYLPKITDETNL